MKKVFVEGNTLRVAEADDDEEYVDTGIYDDDHPRVREERIDGVIYAMSVAPYMRHSMIVGNIEHAIARQLKRPCRVFSEGAAFCYKRDVEKVCKKSDQLQPDIMIACDTTKMLKDGYYGISKFIAEVVSPSTAKYDKTVKFEIYQASSVEEYWIVSPNGTLEIYYLIDGHYELQDTWTLDDEDETWDSYNANTIITLRCFPDIKMTLGEIFE